MTKLQYSTAKENHKYWCRAESWSYVETFKNNKTVSFFLGGSDTSHLSHNEIISLLLTLRASLLDATFLLILVTYNHANSPNSSHQK